MDFDEYERADVTEATQSDLTISGACTKAGIFILLLTLTLIPLIFYWLGAESKEAAKKYITYRLNLSAAFDALEDDNYWLKYKSINENAESMTIQELLEVELILKDVSPEREIEKRQTENTKPQKLKEGKIQAPYLVSVNQIAFIPTLRKIAVQITNLNDLTLLNKSRQAYSAMDFSIYQWHMKLISLISKNDLKEKIVSVDSGLDKKNYFKAKVKIKTEEITHDNFINQSYIKDILSKLTLKDARTLSTYRGFELDGKNILGGEKDPLVPSKISPGELPSDPLMASLFVELLLFFNLVYFYAYTCEATLSKGFTANGTMYGAFSRSIFAQNIFRIGLWSPFALSAFLAYISNEIILWFAFLIVGLTIFLIDKKLHSKRFFSYIWMKTRDIKIST